MNKKSLSSAMPTKVMASVLLCAMIVLQSCSSGEPRLKDFSTKSVYQSTQGVETEVEEVEPGDSYKILDERIIDEKEDSRAIVHYLDGETDTLSLAVVKNANDSTTYGRRHRYIGAGMRYMLFNSLAGSYFRNNLNHVTPDPGVYKDRATYNKTNGLKTNLQQTGLKRTVNVPKGASRGYGKSRSFRSFGG